MLNQDPGSRPWSYSNTKELFRAARSVLPEVDNLQFTRIAPGGGCVTVNWEWSGEERHSDIQFRLQVSERDGVEPVFDEEFSSDQRSAVVRGLTSDIDYELCIVAWGPGNFVAKSLTRLVRTGDVPGTVVNYIHPEDEIYGFSGRSVASPSIVKLPSGELVVSHDVFWQKGGQNVSLIFQSADQGHTWSFLTYLYPCCWGKLFLHQNKLYMLATSTEYGALIIGCSEDGGRNWSNPTVLLEAGSREEGGPHKAPMPVLEHNSRLWTAIDFGTWSDGRGHDSGVLSAPVDSDLLIRESWTLSPFLPYSSEWPGTVSGKTKGLLEGNLLVTPEGSLVNLLRYQTTGGTPDYGRAIYLYADAANPGAPLYFGKVIPFHGNLSKFSILYDSISGLYWSLVNRVTSDNIFQRNVLTLVCSNNLEYWEIMLDVFDYESNGWKEDSSKVAFQYVDWIMEGDEIWFVSRTAVNNAYSYHNANHITFHQIVNFRNLIKSE